MISKKVFCETLEKMKNLDNIEREINDIFRNNDMEFNQISCGDYEDIIYDLLVDAMDDEELGWICYWMFDLDFGRKYDDPEGLRAFDEDNNVIPLRTSEDLYNILTKNTIDKNEKV